MRISASLCPLVLLACLATARAQDVATVVPEGPSKLNADRLRWVQYKMVAGRVVFSSTYPGTNMTFGPALVHGRRRERLEVHITPAEVNLEFELTAPEERLFIAFDSAKKFIIHRALAGAAYEIRFEQDVGQPLTINLAEGDSNRCVRAESFWHLYLSDPQLVRRHLVPLLEILHPSWQLPSIGASIEQLLVERAKNATPLTGEQWLRLVDDLASAKFSDRIGAERSLRAAGLGVMPFLQSLDRRRLDAEQAARVRALVDSLAAGYEDSAERIAPWLAGDTRAWVCLLERDEAPVRRAAAAQLTLMLRGPIAFDPDGEKAVRKVQLERLRERLDKPAAALEGTAELLGR
jgi:hypothetical protein